MAVKTFIVDESAGQELTETEEVYEVRLAGL